jgi:hypothetical protein
MPEPKATMKKIDLRPYTLPRGGKYDIIGSFKELLFHPKQELSVPDSFENLELLKKLESAGDFILVDSGEYRRIMRAYNTMTAPGPDDMEFFRRIRDAEEVPVKEVPHKR